MFGCEEIVREEEKDATCLMTACPFHLPVELWGSLTKAICVVAWALRFGSRSAEGRGTALTYDELVAAKTCLLSMVQDEAFGPELGALRAGKLVSQSSSVWKLLPFLGEDGLLRMGGQLENADMSMDERDPIIVPRGHLALLLVRFQRHLLKHAGVESVLCALRSPIGSSERGD